MEAVLPGNALTGADQGVSLASVSCASAGNCTAVGTYLDSSINREGLLLTETAGTWGNGVEAVLPENAWLGFESSVVLTSVSCASAGNCTAVGSYQVSMFTIEGLLLTETDGAWAPGVEAALPADANGGSAELDSVSCASPGNCSAVGTYNDENAGLLLTETAGSWATGVEAVLPSDSKSEGVQLTAVSCPSPGNCSAVGVYNWGYGPTYVSKGLLLSETAGRWSAGVEAALPADAATGSSTGLSSVSCASAGNCSAVGGYTDTSELSEGLLLTETSGSWARGVEAVLPGNAYKLSSLDSVSCASAGDCSAIGTYEEKGDSNFQQLLLTETAGSWAPGVEAALPANAVATDAGPGGASISCPSAGDCSAVGTYDAGDIDFYGGHGGLLLTEIASSWATGVEAAVPSNALFSDGGVDLTSVSCPLVGNCSSVGSYTLAPDSLGIQGLLLSSPAPAPAPLFWVTVAHISGPGSGTVSSTPAGIDCGTVCGRGYPPGTQVTLTARPAAGSSFSGWSGACSGTGTCKVTTNTDTSVVATFDLITTQLAVAKPGDGRGTVTSSPAGISCRASELDGISQPNCSHNFAYGTSVTLTAQASKGSSFAGWSGPCSGKSTCQVTLQGIVTANANFLRDCAVPKLKNKTLTAARRSLEAHDCTGGKIKHATSQTVEKGHVISQEPKPGIRLKHGAKVNLVVSKGKRH